MDEAFVIEVAPGRLVSTAVHAGHELRAGLVGVVSLDPSTRLREEDPFTDRMLGDIGIRVVVNRSRFEVDRGRPGRAAGGDRLTHRSALRPGASALDAPRHHLPMGNNGGTCLSSPALRRIAGRGTVISRWVAVPRVRRRCGRTRPVPGGSGRAGDGHIVVAVDVPCDGTEAAAQIELSMRRDHRSRVVMIEAAAHLTSPSHGVASKLRTA